MEYDAFDIDFYKSAFIQAPVAIEFYDKNGILTDCNITCLNLFGIKDISQVIGFNLFEDPNLTPEQIFKIKKGENVHYEIDFDFDKVKKYSLFNTNKVGIIFLDISVSVLKKMIYLTDMYFIFPILQIKKQLNKNLLKLLN
jgi:hypothetical protein